jgi:hypothetical protein
LANDIPASIQHLQQALERATPENLAVLETLMGYADILHDGDALWRALFGLFPQLEPVDADGATEQLAAPATLAILGPDGSLIRFDKDEDLDIEETVDCGSDEGDGDCSSDFCPEAKVKDKDKVKSERVAKRGRRGVLASKKRKAVGQCALSPRDESEEKGDGDNARVASRRGMMLEIKSRTWSPQVLLCD